MIKELHPIENDQTAFNAIVSEVLSSAGKLNDESLAILTSDHLARERFLSNSFTTAEGEVIDPAAFLLARLDVLQNTVIQHSVIKPEHMATPSESWHHDNLDGK